MHIEIPFGNSPFNAKLYLVNYIPTTTASDLPSSWIIKFKNGHDYYVQEWTKFCYAEVKDLEVDGIKVKFDYVARMLGSSEVSASVNKPLHKMALALATQLNIPMLPTIFTKSRATKKFARDLPHRSDRMEEIKGVYKVNQDVSLNKKTLLLIDDVSTSGATADTIGSQIKMVFPECILYLLTLGHTRREAGANDQILKEKIAGKYFGHK